MKELGIFIDESGNFEIQKNDFYIVSLVFHDKNKLKITSNVINLENFIESNNLNRKKSIHTIPLIRAQDIYKKMDIDKRRKLFYIFFNFMRTLKLRHKTFVISKKHSDNAEQIKSHLESEITLFLDNNIDKFSQYDDIVIYYDDGQKHLSTILHNIFSKRMKNVRFKENINQEDYRILQCADLCCTLELIAKRFSDNNCPKTFREFFKTKQRFNKTYKKSFEKLNFI